MRPVIVVLVLPTTCLTGLVLDSEFRLRVCNDLRARVTALFCVAWTCPRPWFARLGRKNMRLGREPDALDPEARLMPSKWATYPDVVTILNSAPGAVILFRTYLGAAA